MFIKKKNLYLFLKGIFVGIGTLIPGVSGGTAAILTGVFESSLEAVANIHRHFKRSFIYLFPIFAGAVLGIIVISAPLNTFETDFPIVAKYTFCAVALVSSVIFAKNNVFDNFGGKSIIAVIFGIISAVLISISITYFELNFAIDSALSIFIVSFPLSIALVLPAISFSYMLYFFGLHERTLTAISDIDLSFLLPMALGIIIGSILFSKILLKTIDKHKHITYSFVFGFVIFSITSIIFEH